jgi:hypothetical protein
MHPALPNYKEPVPPFRNWFFTFVHDVPTLAFQICRNNTFFYSPLIRMCRTYNELVCSNKDKIFDISFVLVSCFVSCGLRDRKKNNTFPFSWMS